LWKFHKNGKLWKNYENFAETVCKVHTAFNRTFSLGYFLWGYVKNKVYANAPQTIQELSTISEMFASHNYAKTMRDFLKRVDILH